MFGSSGTIVDAPHLTIARRNGCAYAQSYPHDSPEGWALLASLGWTILDPELPRQIDGMVRVSSPGADWDRADREARTAA